MSASRAIPGRVKGRDAAEGPPAPERLDAALVAPFLPDRPPTGHKGTFGHVLAVAGSSDLRSRLSADRAAAALATSLRRRVRVGHLGGTGRPLDAVIAEARNDLGADGRVLAANYLLAPGFFATRLAASTADIVTAPLSSGVLLDQRLVEVVAQRYACASMFTRPKHTFGRAETRGA